MVDYLDDRGSGERYRALESEIARLKAELENPRHGLRKIKAERDELQSDRDRWREVAGKLAKEVARLHRFITPNKTFLHAKDMCYSCELLQLYDAAVKA